MTRSKHSKIERENHCQEVPRAVLHGPTRPLSDPIEALQNFLQRVAVTLDRVPLPKRMEVSLVEAYAEDDTLPQVRYHEEQPDRASLTATRSRLRSVRLRDYKIGPVSNFQTVSEFDFSHLRVKGLAIRSSPQCASSADQGAYPPPTDHNDAGYVPSYHLYKRTPLPIPPGLLSVGRLFACLCGTPTCKKSQGPS
jgi:hypothetical protein